MFTLFDSLREDKNNLNWMTEIVRRILSGLIFFANAILVSYERSKICNFQSIY
jgi:hypothetical protein